MGNLPNISFVCRSISRREDRRLLTGRGKLHGIQLALVWSTTPQSICLEDVA
jgi:hypothetical protein